MRRPGKTGFIINIFMGRRDDMLKSFFAEEDAIGTVEMILILVVLIGLVLIFKEQLTNLVNKIFKTINSKAGSV